MLDPKAKEMVRSSWGTAKRWAANLSAFALFVSVWSLILRDYRMSIVDAKGALAPMGIIPTLPAMSALDTALLGASIAALVFCLRRKA